MQFDILNIEGKFSGADQGLRRFHWEKGARRRTGLRFFMRYPNVRHRKNESKAKGELAELAFLLKATSLGFAVAKPYGDNQPYDFLIDAGGRPLKVQVKSATRLQSDGSYYHITSQRCSNGKGTPYRDDEIDFLAAYIFQEDVWFIVPAKAFLPRKALHLFPSARANDGRYAHYREAWNLFRAAAASVR